MKHLYHPGKHHRRSIRLKGYDYSQAGLYFMTLCCQNRAHLFGIIEKDKMILNHFGQIAAEEWQKTEEIRRNCRIHEFIIMPNHLHGIIEITFKEGTENEIGKFKSPSHSIGAIIRGFKIATIKRIKEKISEEEKRREKEEEREGEGEEEREKKEDRTGELQFAPTAPTAPTAAEKIKSLNFRIWQRNYYEHIIRTEKAYRNISNYILNNPKKWNEDKFYYRR